MGLVGAGERSQRKPLFPNLMRKHVFDLGCGYGWHFIKSASDTETRRYLSIYIKHPTFTAGVRQEWVYAQGGTPLCWPVDDDYLFSERVTNFFGYEVRKQHHTLQ